VLAILGTVHHPFATWKSDQIPDLNQVNIYPRTLQSAAMRARFARQTWPSGLSLWPPSTLRLPSGNVTNFHRFRGLGRPVRATCDV
jgi:hypothetical protein